MAFRSRWWVVIGCAFGLVASNGPINTFAFGVFLKPVSQDLGISRGTFSAAMGLALLTTALLLPFFGLAVDRFGYRRALLSTLPLYAIGLAALSLLTGSVAQIYLLFVLTGALCAGQTPTAYSKAVAVWFDSSRGLALGISTAGVGIGTAIMPRLADFLIVAVGWRLAYLGLALSVLVLGFIPVFLWVRERDTQAIEPSNILPGVAYKSALQSTLFWRIAVAFLIAAVTILGMLTHLVAMLTDRGFAQAEAVSMLSASGIAIIIGRIFAGYLLDRLFAPYVAIAFFLCPMIGITFLVFGTSAEAAFAGTVLCGLAIGADIDLLPYLLSRYFGLKSFGRLYGLATSIFLVGSALAPTSMGYFFDLSGSYKLAFYIYQPLLLFACFLFLSLGAYAFPVAHDRKEIPPAPSKEVVAV